MDSVGFDLMGQFVRVWFFPGFVVSDMSSYGILGLMVFSETTGLSRTQLALHCLLAPLLC